MNENNITIFSEKKIQQLESEVERLTNELVDANKEIKILRKILDIISVACDASVKSKTQQRIPEKYIASKKA